MSSNDHNSQSNDHKTHDPAKDWYDYEPPSAHVTNYVTWNFDMDDPEGERRLRECLDAPKWKSAAQEFDQWMRARIKYGADGTGADDLVYRATRSHLHTIFGEHGIDIWDE